MTQVDQIKLLTEALCQVSERIRSIEADISELEHAGISNASPWWKEGKYLYLIHKTDDEGNRLREYIGSDETAVNAGLARIERFKRWIELRHQLNELRSNERSAKLSIDHALFYLKSVQRQFWGEK